MSEGKDPLVGAQIEPEHHCRRACFILWILMTHINIDILCILTRGFRFASFERFSVSTSATQLIVCTGGTESIANDMRCLRS